MTQNVVGLLRRCSLGTGEGAARTRRSCIARTAQIKTCQLFDNRIQTFVLIQIILVKTKR